MAPKPVAATIRAGRLLRMFLWACLRLQTEGSSAGHGGPRGVFVRSLSSREENCESAQGGAEEREGERMEWAEMTGRVL
jgi:hypothetical protein